MRGKAHLTVLTIIALALWLPEQSLAHPPNEQPAPAPAQGAPVPPTSVPQPPQPSPIEQLKQKLLTPETRAMFFNDSNNRAILDAVEAGNDEALNSAFGFTTTNKPAEADAAVLKGLKEQYAEHLATETSDRTADQARIAKLLDLYQNPRKKGSDFDTAVQARVEALYQKNKPLTDMLSGMSRGRSRDIEVLRSMEELRRLNPNDSADKKRAAEITSGWLSTLDRNRLSATLQALPQAEPTWSRAWFQRGVARTDGRQAPQDPTFAEFDAHFDSEWQKHATSIREFNQGVRDFFNPDGSFKMERAGEVEAFRNNWKLTRAWAIANNMPDAAWLAGLNVSAPDTSGKRTVSWTFAPGEDRFNYETKGHVRKDVSITATTYDEVRQLMHGYQLNRSSLDSTGSINPTYSGLSQYLSGVRKKDDATWFAPGTEGTRQSAAVSQLNLPALPPATPPAPIVQQAARSTEGAAYSRSLASGRASPETIRVNYNDPSAMESLMSLVRSGNHFDIRFVPNTPFVDVRKLE